MIAYDVFTNAMGAGENLFWVKKRREFDAEDIASVSIQTPDAGNTLLIVTLTRCKRLTNTIYPVGAPPA